MDKFSIHNKMFVAKLKEDVTVDFYERIQKLFRSMLNKQSLSKVNTELALWDRAASECMVSHQMLLFIKRRVAQGRQLWLRPIVEDILHLFDEEVKQYLDAKLLSLSPVKPDERDYCLLCVKVQRILVNNMDTSVFGIRAMSAK